ncbi:DUF2442 domain-containing protein [Solitalea longa]|uniref:DUF2442 domain-containing protein n=1 Tax=Solitalea longa TaxID=2079460 RepID=A0A2S5A7E1_9SPHI|nr:DUF2442 domain-containing protein [Solitalea longa]POY38465.1 DUF2442 domain-containing protein [Solitalea longa]
MYKTAVITELNVLDNFHIKLKFDDGFIRIVDFNPWLNKGPMTKPLSNPEYFKQVKIIDRGHGIEWPNGYDFCPDYLRHLDKYQAESGSNNQVAEPPEEYH